MNETEKTQHNYANDLDRARAQYRSAVIRELTEQVTRTAKDLMPVLIATGEADREALLTGQMVTLARTYYDRGCSDGFWKGIQ